MLGWGRGGRPWGHPVSSAGCVLLQPGGGSGGALASAALTCLLRLAFRPPLAADECHLKATVLANSTSGQHKVKISGLIVGEVSGWLLYAEQVGRPAPAPACALAAAPAVCWCWWG